MSMMTVDRYVVRKNLLVEGVVDFCFSFGANYIMSVSLVTIVALTVLKMIRITRNQWYSKAFMRKLCICVWAVIFLLCTIEYTIYKCNVYPEHYEKHVQRMWIPALSLPSFAILIYSFARMFLHIRRTNGSQNPPVSDGR